MSKPRLALALLPMLAILSGCAMIPAHSVDVSSSFDLEKVGKVVLMPVVFPDEIKRAVPEDFPEMDPANREATGKAIQAALVRALSGSVTIDASFVPDQATKDWAGPIGQDLKIGRIPLGVASATVAADSILLIAANKHGTEKNQYYFEVIGMKKRPFGDPTWDHISDLTCMLVRPSDGKILLTVRHEERANNKVADQAILAGCLDRVAEAVKSAFLRNSR